MTRNFGASKYSALALSSLALSNYYLFPIAALADTLKGGVEVEHQISYSVSIVQTWSGGTPPVVPEATKEEAPPKQPPPEKRSMRNSNSISSLAKPQVAQNAQLKALEGQLDTSKNQASRDAGVPDLNVTPADKPVDVASAFPDLPATSYPGRSQFVPGTTKTTTTETETTDTTTNSTDKWNKGSNANKSSGSGKWGSQQKAGGSAGGFNAWGGLGGGMGIGLGYAMPHFGYAWPGFSMPRLNVPYLGFGLAGAAGIGAMWSSFKTMKKNGGGSKYKNSNKSKTADGSHTTSTTAETIKKTTTTSETTPGYTLNTPGQAPANADQGLTPLENTEQSAPQVVAQQPEATQFEAVEAAPEVKSATEIKPVKEAEGKKIAALHAAPAALNRTNTSTTVGDAPAAPTLVVVPWQRWYQRLTRMVYYRWSGNKPIAGEALVSVTVDEKQQVTSAFLPYNADGATSSRDVATVKDMAQFNDSIKAVMTQLNKDKLIAFPAQSHRHKVSFVLGFSAEDGGTSGCNDSNICDSEQYFLPAGPPKVASQHLPTTGHP
jgi:hypothetical protein